MLGLIYKDFKIYRNTFLCLMGVLLLSNGFIMLPVAVGTEEFKDAMNSMPALFGMMCAGGTLISFYIAGMFQESLISGDEQKKWAYFITSTDNGIKRMVGSKYIIILIYSMMTAFMCSFMNKLCADIIGQDAPDNTNLILLLFFVQLMCRGFSVPFLFSFGSKKGNTVRLTAVITVIIAGLIYGLFGDLSIINPEKIWEMLMDMMTDLSQNWKLMLGQAMFFVIVIVMYIVSYKLSCRYYLKGVEHYDK